MGVTIGLTEPLSCLVRLLLAEDYPNMMLKTFLCMQDTSTTSAAGCSPSFLCSQLFSADFLSCVRHKYVRFSRNFNLIVTIVFLY